jgi:hypothetical protein
MGFECYPLTTGRSVITMLPLAAQLRWKLDATSDQCRRIAERRLYLSPELPER